MCHVGLITPRDLPFTLISKEKVEIHSITHLYAKPRVNYTTRYQCLGISLNRVSIFRVVKKKNQRFYKVGEIRYQRFN